MERQHQRFTPLCPWLKERQYPYKPEIRVKEHRVQVWEAYSPVWENQGFPHKSHATKLNGIRGPRRLCRGEDSISGIMVSVLSVTFQRPWTLELDNRSSGRKTRLRCLYRSAQSGEQNQSDVTTRVQVLALTCVQLKSEPTGATVASILWSLRSAHNREKGQ